METILRKVLKDQIRKGLMTIPEGWGFEGLVDYYLKCVPEHVWKRDFLGLEPGKKRVMAKNTEVYNRLEKTLSRMEKMRKKKLLKLKKNLEKKARFYGLDPTLFGEGTVDLIDKKDLTLGIAAKALEQTKQTTIARLYEVKAKAKAKGMVKPFNEAVDAALRMSKSQGESSIYFALNEVAEAFTRQLESIADKRMGPRADGMPAARPTVDDEDEDEKSPKAEED